MPEVFIDTSGWASLFVRTEPFHRAADAMIRKWQSNGTGAVTTNYVMTELVALFTSPLRLPRERQIRSIEAIEAENWVDCSSFALMSQRGIGEALTADHHFEQAGFQRLLK